MHASLCGIHDDAIQIRHIAHHAGKVRSAALLMLMGKFKLVQMGGIVSSVFCILGLSLLKKYFKAAAASQWGQKIAKASRPD
jgi:hypothetical protein